MRTAQLARLQKLARLRETRARAALGQATRAREALEAERQSLSDLLRAAQSGPGRAEATQFHAAARLDLRYSQGLAAYRQARPLRDAEVARARADYARSVGQLRALAELQKNAEAAARRKDEAREEEGRNAGRPSESGGHLPDDEAFA